MSFREVARQYSQAHISKSALTTHSSIEDGDWDRGTLNDMNGTCLRGYIDCTYGELVSILGQPDHGDGYKTQAEWVILSGDIVATIYDWKQGYAYMEEYGIPPELVTEWNIGGNSRQAVELVNRILGKYGTFASRKTAGGLFNLRVVNGDYIATCQCDNTIYCDDPVEDGECWYTCSMCGLEGWLGVDEFKTARRRASRKIAAPVKFPSKCKVCGDSISVGSGDVRKVDGAWYTTCDAHKPAQKPRQTYQPRQPRQVKMTDGYMTAYFDEDDVYDAMKDGGWQVSSRRKTAGWVEAPVVQAFDVLDAENNYIATVCKDCANRDYFGLITEPTSHDDLEGDPSVGIWPITECSGCGASFLPDIMWEASRKTASSIQECQWCLGPGDTNCNWCEGTGYLESVQQADGSFGWEPALRPVESVRKIADVQYIEVQSTYRAYLPVRGGKYHLGDGLPQWPTAACNVSIELDSATLMLISPKSPARASSFCPECAKIIANSEA